MKHWYTGLKCERCGQKIVPANSGIYQQFVDGKKLAEARAWHWPEDCPAKFALEKIGPQC